MHRLLARQLKKTLGVSSEEEIRALIADLRGVTRRDDKSEAVANFLDGMEELLKKINYSYEQNQRDLDLLHRTLKVSSDELTQANERLQSELAKRNQAIQALRESQGKMSAILDTAADGILAIDSSGQVQSVNRAALENFGYEQSEMIGHNVNKLMPEPYHSEHSGYLKRYLDTGVPHIIGTSGREVAGRKKDGTVFPLELSVSEVDTGRDRLFVGILRDITVKNKLLESMKLAARVFEDSIEGIMITLRDGTIIEVNDAFTNITGFQRNEVLGNKPNMLKSGRHDKGFYEGMWKALFKEGSWRGEIWDRKKSGEVYPKWLSIGAVKGLREEVTHFVAIFTDITSVKQREEDLQQVAHYDFLTGLPNRILFRDRLSQAVHQAKRNKTMVGLMFIDLDGFKKINDTLGHKAGDDLLIEVARRLEASIRKTDTASRLGGDEFTVILTEAYSLEFMAALAGKIIGVVGKPIQIGSNEAYVTASIGIAVYHNDAVLPDELIKNADAAMYYAKKHGKNNFQFYHSMS